MPQFSEEDLALMTPAEREAVTAEDDNSDMQGNFGYDDDGDDDVTDVEPKEKPAEAPKAAEQDAEPADPFGLNKDEPKATFIAQGVDNYDDQVTALEGKKDDAFKKMMDGEITDTEYRTIEKEVSSELRQLDRKQSQAEISAEMTRQQATNAWGDYVGQQIEATKAAGADLTSSDKLMSELDRTVKLLAAQVRQDPDMVKHLSATKPGSLITNVDKWVLNEAIEIVKTRNNLVAKPVIDKAKGRAPDLSGIPPSLGKVPVAADPNTQNGDEFAHLSNLRGAEYERGLARLTPDQLERFMG